LVRRGVPEIAPPRQLCRYACYPFDVKVMTDKPFWEEAFSKLEAVDKFGDLPKNSLA
jgi:hypothetical protein